MKQMIKIVLLLISMFWQQANFALCATCKQLIVTTVKRETVAGGVIIGASMLGAIAFALTYDKVCKKLMPYTYKSPGISGVVRVTRKQALFLGATIAAASRLGNYPSLSIAKSVGTIGAGVGILAACAALSGLAIYGYERKKKTYEKSDYYPRFKQEMLDDGIPEENIPHVLSKGLALDKTFKGLYYGGAGAVMLGVAAWIVAQRYRMSKR